MKHGCISILLTFCFLIAGSQQPADTLGFKNGKADELEEVLISATRSIRSFRDIPTRVETITAGELHEKAVMQPGNIRMLVTESTGIQTQQTSAVSGKLNRSLNGMMFHLYA
jgi:hypothetical protein